MRKGITKQIQTNSQSLALAKSNWDAIKRNTLAIKNRVIFRKAFIICSFGFLNPNSCNAITKKGRE